MNWNVLSSIFKRNFVSYFYSPTGYVFICVFVALTSAAAFWPPDFFASNLANLDQLNEYFPLIMLVFVPAITMSIWAEERRLGTDELVLTMPASDLDVVIGKFLAAIAIYSVSLAFSFVANFAVLGRLGNPDWGLLISTYVGYWFVGMTMISIGMVASFLTSNLTVAFVLGALLNAPLALSGYADAIVTNPTAVAAIRSWSLSQQFGDFQRGVISLSSIVYFVAVTAVMLYLNVVLIGRRHWLGGRDGQSMAGHYLARTVSLIVIAGGLSMLAANYDVMRLDITEERLSSLSPRTRQLIKDLDTDFPVQIEAYISPQVPQEYVPARLNLISTLREMDTQGGNKIQVDIFDVENYSKEAQIAEEKYGITPQTVITKSHGARKEEEIIMGVAFRSGLERTMLPFIDKGLPAEYELIRSIARVTDQEKKTVGVLATDAQLFGDFMSGRPEQPLIDELRKQYEVVEVDASSPITDEYDVLLAVQPSTLAPDAMKNFIDAVKRGQPTAIFEDPYPRFWSGVAGTGQPRMPANQQMMMFQQPRQQPKGDISELWEILGMKLPDETIVWQDYNPYPKLTFADRDWVFVQEAQEGKDDAFNDDHPVSSDLYEVLFLRPGTVNRLNSSKLEFSQLAVADRNTGTVNYSDLAGARTGGVVRWLPTNEDYVIAAHIKGKLPLEMLLEDLDDLSNDTPSPNDGASIIGIDEDETLCQEEETSEDTGSGNDEPKSSGKPKKMKEPEVNVVVVADIDCLIPDFFQIRERGSQDFEDFPDFQFQNVTFILNTLDYLAEDDRFLEIRKRRRLHRTLTQIDNHLEDAREDMAEKEEEYREEFTEALEAEQEKLDEQLEKIRNNESMDRNQRQQMVAMVASEGQRRLAVKTAELEAERDKKIEEIERDFEARVRSVQHWYKLNAVFVPPVIPLLVAAFVYFRRRNQESEGVISDRLE